MSRYEPDFSLALGKNRGRPEVTYQPSMSLVHPPIRSPEPQSGFVVVHSGRYRHRASGSSQGDDDRRRRQGVRPQRPRRATDQDARAWGLETGLEMARWDPDEQPFVFLGSILDQHNLGRLILDYSVAFRGSNAPMTAVVEDFCDQLLVLNEDLKQCKHFDPSGRSQESRDTVDWFLSTGDKMNASVQHLLKVCQEYMLGSLREDGSVGREACARFIDVFLGRDYELEKAEMLTQNMHAWHVDFQKSCAPRLRGI
ncbi:hypothetical protein J7T55_010632 [Diaporthe amygdali]|uniref:uncharacterized protein n=1 Tax=Phomopsis amygdali TaxID=1214568 RepID=UPI0022FE4D5D|nr:uncharacterized protein J7T55_010632 [Diaporthe amygdali]KAJ0114245.1 hypothetical protein J7T55_010632 [Diaporthe amygdali]